MTLQVLPGRGAADHKIDDIQILRGIAISMVLICHLSFSATLLAALPFPVTNSFYAGVELFFVISGFVVTRSLIRGRYDPVAFLIRRAFRLYPPIFAFLAFCGVINGVIRAAGAPAYAFDNLCMPLAKFVEQGTAILGGYLINRPDGAAYMNGAMWSLSVEFQFYAVAALLAAVAMVLRTAPRLTGYAVMASAGAIYVVCVYARIMLTAGESPEFGAYLIRFRFDYMALGVLLAYVPARIYSQAFRFGRVLSLASILVPIIVLALCRSPLTPNAAGPDYLDGLGMLLVAPCYLGLVALAVGGNVSRALPGALGRFLFMVGERSYTIYLLHFPSMVVAWVLIMGAYRALASDARPYTALLLVVVACLGYAVIVRNAAATRALANLLAPVRRILREHRYMVGLSLTLSVLIVLAAIEADHRSRSSIAGTYAIAQVIATALILVPATEVVYRLIEIRSIEASAAIVAAWRRRRSVVAPARQQA